MNSGSGIYRKLFATVRVCALLVLLCSILLPKISLALVFAMGGEQINQVIICTGNGLERVTIAADGQMIDDDEEASWVSPHCVPPDEYTTRLERAWQNLSFPDFRIESTPRGTEAIAPYQLARSLALSRAPPTT